eukprot:g64858.t1
MSEERTEKSKSWGPFLGALAAGGVVAVCGFRFVRFLHKVPTKKSFYYVPPGGCAEEPPIGVDPKKWAEAAEAYHAYQAQRHASGAAGAAAGPHMSQQTEQHSRSMNNMNRVPFTEEHSRAERLQREYMAGPQEKANSFNPRQDFKYSSWGEVEKEQSPRERYQDRGTYNFGNWGEDVEAGRAHSHFQEQNRERHERFFRERNEHHEERYTRQRTQRLTNSQVAAAKRLLEMDLHVPITVTGVRTAFREMAKRTHPDAGGTHEGFSQVQSAYDILMEEAKHAESHKMHR